MKFTLRVCLVLQHAITAAVRKYVLSRWKTDGTPCTEMMKYYRVTDAIKNVVIRKVQTRKCKRCYRHTSARPLCVKQKQNNKKTEKKKPGTLRLNEKSSLNCGLNGWKVPKCCKIAESSGTRPPISRTEAHRTRFGRKRRPNKGKVYKNEINFHHYHYWRKRLIKRKLL